MTSPEQIIHADLTWTGDAFEQDVRIAVDREGRITSVGRSDKAATVRLAGKAILPGFVNAHSHAFQRALRGKGETFPSGAGSFWSWRDAMYKLVSELDKELFFEVTRDAFAEMRQAGITTVGEFHYLHHSTNDTDYEFDKLTLQAASQAGIRIVLLNTYYRTGGVNQPLNPSQQRFRSNGPERFLEHLDGLMAKSTNPTHTFGVVVHSVRAASPDDLGLLHEGAVQRNLPFHIHVEEQRREIEEVLEAYGKTPLAIVNSTISNASNVTAVHCTHSDQDDLSTFLTNGGTICVCPLTEANLGDGIPNFPESQDAAKQICVGTDSNLRISMTEEMRWLEYGQRLRTESRGAYRDAAGRMGKVLFDCATVNGAASLSIPGGKISPGNWADFAAIDLTHPTLIRVAEGNLLDALTFSTGNSVISATCVAGNWQDNP